MIPLAVRKDPAANLLGDFGLFIRHLQEDSSEKN